MLTFSSYFSIEYLIIFLPLPVAAYPVLPHRSPRLSLLAPTYLFFWAVSRKLIAYLIFSTLSVHYMGKWLSRIHNSCDCLLESAPK